MLIMKLKQKKHLLIMKLLNKMIQLMKNQHQRNQKKNLHQNQKHYQGQRKKLK